MLFTAGLMPHNRFTLARKPTISRRFLNKKKEVTLFKLPLGSDEID